MSSSSFVYTLPLKVSRKEEKVLNKRFDAARQLYNACLGESLRRLDLMRQAKTYQYARKCKKKKERNDLFREARQDASFSEYDLHKFVTEIKNKCGIKKHIDSNSAQKLATRAFDAVAKYSYKQRGRPRFKGKGRLRSLEGKSNAAGIRFKDGKIHWSGLNLDLCYDKKDKHGVETHALLHRTKYVRLVKKTIRFKPVFYVQLIQEGTPKQKEKNTVGNDKVGLDIGPSTIAMVSSKQAFLSAFCAELKLIQKQIAQTQRLLDRSKRATNKDNFNENGTIKKGRRQWRFSNRYHKNKAKAAELQRKTQETRKKLHGQMANDILRFGREINTEKLSYLSFQKNYGKSVGNRAPGKFIEILSQKAERAGGKVVHFSTYKTKLSQACHGCGVYVKKSLSKRWHDCSCGVGPVQRDLYSAYLAQFVVNDCLDKSQAEKAWTGAEPLLRHALSRLDQSASGKLRLSSFGLSKPQRQSASHVEEGSTSIDTVDVVRFEKSIPESHRELPDIALRTP